MCICMYVCMYASFSSRSYVACVHVLTPARVLSFALSGGGKQAYQAEEADTGFAVLERAGLLQPARFCTELRALAGDEEDNQDENEEENDEDEDGDGSNVPACCTFDALVGLGGGAASVSSSLSSSSCFAYTAGGGEGEGGSKQRRRRRRLRFACLPARELALSAEVDAWRHPPLLSQDEVGGGQRQSSLLCFQPVNVPPNLLLKVRACVCACMCLSPIDEYYRKDVA